MNSVRPATRWSVPQTIAWMLTRDDGFTSELRNDSEGQPTTLAALRHKLTERWPPTTDARLLVANAVAELVEELGRTKLLCIGSRTTGGITQAIPADNWPGLKLIDTSKERLSVNARLSIKSSAEAVYAVPRGLNLRGTYRDIAPYCDEKGVITFWTDLSLNILDVERVWPKRSGSLTGCAGRPVKSRTLFEEEMRRRAAGGRLEPFLRREVNALLQLLSPGISADALPKQKTLENNLRDLYGELKQKSPKL